jgi:hypothetical protein
MIAMVCLLAFLFAGVASPQPVLTVKPSQITFLAAELQDMAAADQAVRFERPPVRDRIRAMDKKHYARLVQIYRTYGWPAISLVGKKAANNYWLLAQHQGLAFQKMVLPGMKRAVDKGESSKTDYAYLYDRVMMREGKPQHWGTQGSCVNGKARLYNVDERATLDRRRAALDLWPEKEYLDMLCHPPRT